MFFVDDHLAFHRKLALLPNSIRTRCMGVWVLAGCWAKAALSGGHVPMGQVALLGGTKSDAEALVTATLWERTDTGYVFHDWADWQETTAELEHKRERERLKKAAWRKRRAERNGVGVPNGHNGESTGPSPKLSTRKSTVKSTGHVPALSTMSTDSLAGAPLIPLPLPLQTDTSNLAAALITSNHPRVSPGRTESGGGVNSANLGESEKGPGKGSKTVADVLDALRERFPVSEASRPLVARLTAWLEANHPGQVLAVAESMAATFAADPWSIDNGHPLADLVKRPERYLSRDGLIGAKHEAAQEALRRSDLETFRALQAEIRTLKGAKNGTR